MGYWKFIVPEATTNLLSDPSFALADPDTEWDFAGDGAAPDWTRSTAQSFYGFSSAVVDVDAGGGGTWSTIYQTIAVTNVSYTLSARIRDSAGVTSPPPSCVARFDSSNVAWDSTTELRDGWFLCVYTGTATAGNREFGVRAAENGLFVDAVQLEQHAYRTTYCDGYQPGCEWNGGENTSTSSRSAVSRAGGRVYDFEDDYSFAITDWAGWGMPPEILGVDKYAILPGGMVNSSKTDVNVLTLTGYFHGTTLANLHSLRQALVEELATDKYPKTGDGWQPVRIRYTGAAITKEARVFYDSGLEGGRVAGYTETTPVRFLMADPFWYEIGNSSQVLDTNDTATLRYLAARLKATGQWDDVGLTANPAGGAGTIYGICVASNGSVYFAGDYDGLNNDGAPADAGCDYICRYDPSDETFNVLVGASDVGDAVYSVIEGPDGTIYICGDFTGVNGVGTADYIVSYDPDADTWSSLDDPDSGGAAWQGNGGFACAEMAFDSDGNLYVVGDFTTINGVANASYIAMWDGTSWNAVGAPSVGAGYPTCIAIDSQDNIVVGGTFTNFAGDADADYLAIWDGSSWSDLGSGTQSGNVNTLVFDKDDTLYLGGSFTNQGGDADCDYMCSWNGRQFIPLQEVPVLTVYDLAIAPDGRVFMTGSTWTSVNLLAAWNGSAFELWDINIDAITIAIGQPDSTIAANYNIWLGHATSSSISFAGDTTVTNGGTATRYPVIFMHRSGGTAANLYTIRNETTGKALMFNYALLDGERIMIDCRPGAKTVSSSFFGPRFKPQGSSGGGGGIAASLGAPAVSPVQKMLATSDFGTFALHPGDNLITAYVYESGGPTVTAWMEWRAAYRGMD